MHCTDAYPSHSQITSHELARLSPIHTLRADIFTQRNFLLKFHCRAREHFNMSTANSRPKQWFVIAQLGDLR